MWVQEPLVVTSSLPHKAPPASIPFNAPNAPFPLGIPLVLCNDLFDSRHFTLAIYKDPTDKLPMAYEKLVPDTRLSMISAQ